MIQTNNLFEVKLKCLPGLLSFVRCLVLMTLGKLKLVRDLGKFLMRVDL